MLAGHVFGLVHHVRRQAGRLDAAVLEVVASFVIAAIGPDHRKIALVITACCRCGFAPVLQHGVCSVKAGDGDGLAAFVFHAFGARQGDGKFWRLD